MLVPITDLVESELAMRYLDKTRLEYTQVRDSIAARRWIRPITVRKRTDGRYDIIDGLHRYSAAKELFIEEVPIEIVEADDDEAILMGIVANALTVPPKPVEYAYQLRRLATRRPDYTVGYLAGLVNQTPEWVKKQLGLLRLVEPIQRDVDAGRINVQSAYVLSLCPKTWQLEYRNEALTSTTEELRAKVVPQLKSWHTSMMAGRAKMEETPFEPIASVRPMKVLRAALDKPSVADTMVLEGKCESLADAFRLGVQWALSLDPVAVQQQRLEVERKREKLKRAEDRQRKARALRAGNKKPLTESTLSVSSHSEVENE